MRKTGYRDIRGDEIYDGDILRDHLYDPINDNKSDEYWRVYYDDHLQQWYAYTDNITVPLRRIAHYVWRYNVTERI